MTKRKRPFYQVLGGGLCQLVDGICVIISLGFWHGPNAALRYWRFVVGRECSALDNQEK